MPFVPYTCSMILESTAENIARAATVLQEGGCVAIPTETVYGLAARIDREGAIREIFERKGRPADNPLIVHVASVEDAVALVREEDRDHLRRLANNFWPGPLTVVLTKDPSVSDAVTAGQHTVAIRMPDHPIARAVILAAGAPLAAPSANRSGRPSPTTAAHVEADLGPDLLILDGGPCAVGIESTVVRVVEDGLLLLRPGGVDASSLSHISGLPLQRATAASDLKASPGTRYRHYAPHAEVVIATDDSTIHGLVTEVDGRAMILVRPGVSLPFKHAVVSSLTEQDLYAEFRRADDLQLARIVVLCDDVVRSREALYNRVLRAVAAAKDEDPGP